MFEDEDFRITKKDQVKFIGSGLFYLVLLLAIGTGVTAFQYWLKPIWLGMERKAYVESHQYVESRKDAALKTADEIAELESQMDGISAQMLPLMHAQDEHMIKAAAERDKNDTDPERVKKVPVEDPTLRDPKLEKEIEQLNTLMEQLEMQQQTLQSRLRREVAKMKPQDVPPGINRYL